MEAGESDAGTYVGEVALPPQLFGLFSFHQDSVLAGKSVAPLFLPEALVYRHDVTLGGEDVLVVRLVKRIVLVEQLRFGKKQASPFLQMTKRLTAKFATLSTTSIQLIEFLKKLEHFNKETSYGDSVVGECLPGRGICTSH